MAFKGFLLSCQQDVTLIDAAILRMAENIEANDEAVAPVEHQKPCPVHGTAKMVGASVTVHI